MLEKEQKCLLGLNIINSTVPENIHIMKFRSSRKLKNMILSFNFCNSDICFSFMSNFLQHFTVGRYDFFLFLFTCFFFFWKAIKNSGSAQKTGSFGLTEAQVFFMPNSLLNVDQDQILCYVKAISSGNLCPLP